jgi:DNA (cytosine-5)-methyltransferase 1
MARIIGEVRPRFAFVENSPMLVGRGLAVVLSDLAEMGYDARWGVLGANRCGGQHKRDRIWVVADSDQGTFQQLGIEPPKNRGWGSKEIRRKNWIDFLVDNDRDIPPSWRCEDAGIDPRPIMRGDSDGMADGMDRIARIGNGQVPAVAALAWRILTNRQQQPTN